MKFVAPEQAPEQAEIIRNTPFWPMWTCRSFAVSCALTAR